MNEDLNGCPVRDCLAGLEEQKWYTHDEGMIALSRRWPAYIFRLEGEGEDQGDHWVKFYQGGRVEEHRQPAWDPPGYPSPEWLAAPHTPAD